MVLTERIENGREFQIAGAAKEKDRSPKVLVGMQGLQSMRVSEDERSVLDGV